MRAGLCCCELTASRIRRLADREEWLASTTAEDRAMHLHAAGVLRELLEDETTASAELAKETE